MRGACDTAGPSSFCPSSPVSLRRERPPRSAPSAQAGFQRISNFVARTYRVTVADGQLTLLLDDLGGADPNVVINALEVK